MNVGARAAGPLAVLLGALALVATGCSSRPDTGSRWYGGDQPLTWTCERELMPQVKGVRMCFEGWLDPASLLPADDDRQLTGFQVQVELAPGVELDIAEGATFQVLFGPTLATLDEGVIYLPDGVAGGNGRLSWDGAFSLDPTLALAGEPLDLVILVQSDYAGEPITRLELVGGKVTVEEKTVDQ